MTQQEGRYAQLRKGLLAETKAAIAASVTPDQLIIQASTSLDQLEHALHSLTKKAREWYSLINPELERKFHDHDAFLQAATTETRGAMGGELKKEELATLQGFLDTLKALAAEKKALRAHLDAMMKQHCPNLAFLATPRIGAQLLVHAGSLAHLATVPSSTIQLYGAESALFRHLKDKRRHRSPKYGLLFNHPLIQHVEPKLRGKAARTLADKLSICAKLDHFGEEQEGGARAIAYQKALEAKFGAWSEKGASEGDA